MPIEIKEMHIKINVDEGASSGNSADDISNQKDKRDAIVAACIESVMQILDRQKER